MKTIFVTIDEFLSNGGILTPGRIIYREERRWFNSNEFNKNEMLKNSLILGEYIGHDKVQGTYLLKNSTFKSFPMTGSIAYVKIEASPIFN